MSEIVLILHNIRSTHNVGSIFRSADGFGVKKIILSGYSPYPQITNDSRLPHIREKLTSQIHKTALGAELTTPFEYCESVDFHDLREDGYTIVGLEQVQHSILLPKYTPPAKFALVLGEEVHGLSSTLLTECDDLIEIPMHGKKESFNVSVAAGIALYGLIYPPK